MDFLVISRLRAGGIMALVRPMAPMRPILHLAAAVLVLGIDPGHAAGGRPSVLFFLADDLGWADIGANHPGTFYETPNIDGIAARGMRFTQGYAACPVCSPTRGSIMTGKYPPRFGVTDFIPGMRNGRLLSAPNASHLPLEEVTLAEAFREAGYATFFAGKWHLGPGEFSPSAQGFPDNLVNGDGRKGIQQFFYPADSLPADSKQDPKTTDRIADAAVRFVRHHTDKPFFAYLPFLAVHTPIGARPDLVTKYQKKKEQAPADEWGREREREVRLVQNHATYAAMLEQMDSAIGRVVGALRDAGIEDRTIVVFMSDNGGLSTSEGHPTSNLPLRAGKGWLYEGGIRTAFIIAAPGVTQPGSTCDTPVISTDYYPTLLELAGLPQRPQQHLDGVSLVPLLRGGSLPERALFWHYPHYGNQGGAPSGCVRMGDWKLIEWYEDNRAELFNLRGDIGERRDVAPQMPEKVGELTARLHEWRRSVGGIMPKPNPDWQPATEAAGSQPKRRR